VKAVIAYQKKLNSLTSVPKPVKLNKEMENKRKIIVRSFSLAKNLYTMGRGNCSSKDSELEVGAEFLEVQNFTPFMFLFQFRLNALSFLLLFILVILSINHAKSVC